MRLAILALPLILGGCMSMPISTMYKMATLNPLEIDPGQVQLAVRTDNRVNIGDDGVTISMGYVSEDKSLDLDHEFPVVVDRNARNQAILLDDMKQSEQVVLFRLRQQDRELMRQFQQKVHQHKENGGEGSGSFGIRLSEFCLKADAPTELETDMFLQVDKQDGFFVFFEDVDIREPQCDECEVEEIPVCADTEIS